MFKIETFTPPFSNNRDSPQGCEAPAALKLAADEVVACRTSPRTRPMGIFFSLLCPRVIQVDSGKAE